MNNPRVTEHRLGIAKSQLKKITKHRLESWESYEDGYHMLRLEAKAALEALKTIPNKNQKAREEARLKGLNNPKATTRPQGK